MKENVQKFGIEGFARIHLKEDGKLIGDSDWIKNTIGKTGGYRESGSSGAGHQGSQSSDKAQRIDGHIGGAVSIVFEVGRFCSKSMNKADFFYHT